LILKKIILHIGHNKTGSSYLQSFLAINRKKFLKLGINYPYTKSFKHAKQCGITSGNGLLFVENLNIESLNEKEIILFSSELLYRKLLYKDWDFFQKFLKKNGPQLKIILYSRNLFAHALSRWGQRIKRHKEVKDIDSYLRNNALSDVHLCVLKWITLSKEFNFELIIRNYSKHKTNLLDTFLKDVIEKKNINMKFNLPKYKQINRSLTFSEYEIMRVCNKIKNLKGNLSDLLIYQLPLIEGTKVKCNQKTYDLLYEKNIETINKINAQINEDESIIIEPPEKVVYGMNDFAYRSLSEEQISLISSYIKNHIKQENIKSKNLNLISKINKNLSNKFPINLFLNKKN